MSYLGRLFVLHHDASPQGTLPFPSPHCVPGWESPLRTSQLAKTTTSTTATNTTHQTTLTESKPFYPCSTTQRTSITGGLIGCSLDTIGDSDIADEGG
jgi:hypothetical protein